MLDGSKEGCVSGYTGGHDGAAGEAACCCFDASERVAVEAVYACTDPADYEGEEEEEQDEDGANEETEQQPSDPNEDPKPPKPKKLKPIDPPTLRLKNAIESMELKRLERAITGTSILKTYGGLVSGVRADLLHKIEMDSEKEGWKLTDKRIREWLGRWGTEEGWEEVRIRLEDEDHDDHPLLLGVGDDGGVGLDGAGEVEDDDA
ncbi:hypothetical protein HDU97_001900 [Phlyctochytrium planicorne]|nr:hypothetical protein HDU97_001900 [Phlyctochytrium planicorne]